MPPVTLKVSPSMSDFTAIKLLYGLTSPAGLALADQYLKRIDIEQLVDRAFPMELVAVIYSVDDKDCV